MFTINIRDIVAVGKSGMKWNLNTGNYTDKQNEQIPSDSNAASKAVVEAANNPAASPALKADVQEVIKSAKKEEKELQIDIGAASDFKATLDKGPDGKVKLGSMTAIIAAGDDNIVESRNVGWIGRNLLSKGEQKFSFGELQIYNRLMANIKTPAELDALAVRIGAQPLPWNTTLDDISIHRDTAINDFRDKMAQRVSEMATIGQLTLGERGAVAGLESVISGRTDQFKQALTANKDALKQAAQKLSNNASGLETFLNTLAKIGIILPLNILSNYGVLLTADSKNVDKKLGTTGGLETKFAQFGEAGNLAASIKAIGLAIDVNTNDPSQRITHRTADFLKAVEAKDADVMKASEVVVTKAKEDNKNLSTEDLTKLENLSKNYISIQKTSVDTVATNNNIDPKVYGDILADQTFRYLSQVEELK